MSVEPGKCDHELCCFSIISDACAVAWYRVNLIDVHISGWFCADTTLVTTTRIMLSWSSALMKLLAASFHRRTLACFVILPTRCLTTISEQLLVFHHQFLDLSHVFAFWFFMFASFYLKFSAAMWIRLSGTKDSGGWNNDVMAASWCLLVNPRDRHTDKCQDHWSQ